MSTEIILLIISTCLISTLILIGVFKDYLQKALDTVKKSLDIKKKFPFVNEADLVMFVLGIGIFYWGVSFLYEYRRYGEIYYFFKIPISVKDSTGSYLLSIGLISFGFIIAAYNAYLILRSWLKSKNSPPPP